MELIIQNDGLYQLVPVTKEMMEHISLLVKVDCMESVRDTETKTNKLRR